MNSYNRTYLDTIAKEKGFIRDNLEKVMRLAQILKYFSTSKLLSESLVLKGGTAINLTVFQMPRLSVDIDLDYAINCSREKMLSARKQINAEIQAYMGNEGYALKPNSKNPHALDSWVFGYTNAGGNADNIKIEINYSDRCHVLPIAERAISIDFLGDINVKTLSPLELFASKIKALLERAAVRDIYDVHNMIASGLFNNDEERKLLRKIVVFYLSVGSACKAEDVSLQSGTFDQVEGLTFTKVRAQLLPVLSRRESFNLQETKTEVTAFLHDFLTFADAEYSYIEAFNKREYKPELLFGKGEIAERIASHPMALWKCRPKD